MMNMIGWAIIHSIWQAGLVAVCTASLLFVCRGASAAARYRIAVIGLFMLAIAPVVTVLMQREAVVVASTTSSIPTETIEAPAQVVEPGDRAKDRSVTASR